MQDQRHSRLIVSPRYITSCACLIKSARLTFDVTGLPRPAGLAYAVPNAHIPGNFDQRQIMGVFQWKLTSKPFSSFGVCTKLEDDRETLVKVVYLEDVARSHAPHAHKLTKNVQPKGLHSTLSLFSIDV
eukprot:1161868-Pelagomonas_calceolata.AAC.12